MYAEILGRMHQKLTVKRPGKVERGVLLLQDNAPCHKEKAAMQKLDDLGIKTVPHPPYSPELAPSDFHLFRVFRGHPQGLVFGDHDELASEVVENLRHRDILRTIRPPDEDLW